MQQPMTPKHLEEITKRHVAESRFTDFVGDLLPAHAQRSQEDRGALIAEVHRLSHVVRDLVSQLAAAKQPPSQGIPNLFWHLTQGGPFRGACGAENTATTTVEDWVSCEACLRLILSRKYLPQASVQDTISALLP